MFNNNTTTSGKSCRFVFEGEVVTLLSFVSGGFRASSGVDTLSRCKLFPQVRQNLSSKLTSIPHLGQYIAVLPNTRKGQETNFQRQFIFRISLRPPDSILLIVVCCSLLRGETRHCHISFMLNAYSPPNFLWLQAGVANDRFWPVTDRSSNVA